ncbi:hypothetical protein LTR17_003477 [Elasticomyces elasticus]|nr:hypothetical protein LTR17_003477 [Elasticomyces elasticus]
MVTPEPMTVINGFVARLQARLRSQQPRALVPQLRAARSYSATRSSQHICLTRPQEILDKPSLGHDAINNQLDTFYYVNIEVQHREFYCQDPHLCDYAYYVFEKEQQFLNVICQDFKHSEQYEILDFACLRNNTINNLQVLHEGFVKH